MISVSVCGTKYSSIREKLQSSSPAERASGYTDAERVPASSPHLGKKKKSLFLWYYTKPDARKRSLFDSCLTLLPLLILSAAEKARFFLDKKRQTHSSCRQGLLLLFSSVKFLSHLDRPSRHYIKLWQFCREVTALETDLWFFGQNQKASVHKKVWGKVYIFQEMPRSL